MTQINIFIWFFCSNGTLDSLTEITFLVVIWNIILINSLSVVSYVNRDWSMTICAKGNSCWNFWISNMPISWYILLNISINFLICYTSYIIVTARNYTAIWVSDFFTILINISYGCLLCVWCISNLNWSKVTISCYFYTFNLSLTRSVAWNNGSIVFTKVTSCPVTVFSYFTCYLVNCCSSS